jgi:hypothetical protein
MTFSSVAGRTHTFCAEALHQLSVLMTLAMATLKCRGYLPAIDHYPAVFVLPMRHNITRYTSCEQLDSKEWHR